jgi:hypothetical protein
MRSYLLDVADAHLCSPLLPFLPIGSPAQVQASLRPRVPRAERHIQLRSVSGLTRRSEGGGTVGQGETDVPGFLSDPPSTLAPPLRVVLLLVSSVIHPSYLCLTPHAGFLDSSLLLLPPLPLPSSVYRALTSSPSSIFSTAHQPPVTCFRLASAPPYPRAACGSHSAPGLPPCPLESRRRLLLSTSFSSPLSLSFSLSPIAVHRHTPPPTDYTSVCTSIALSSIRPRSSSPRCFHRRRAAARVYMHPALLAKHFSSCPYSNSCFVSLRSISFISLAPG